MATLCPGWPGEPGEPAEVTNRVFLFLLISPKNIVFGDFFKETQAGCRFYGHLKTAFFHFDHCREGLLRSEHGSPGGRG